MPYEKDLEENYTPDWIEQINPKPFIPDLVPWLNESQIGMRGTINSMN